MPNLEDGALAATEEYEDNSGRSLQQLANAALKGISDFQPARGMIKSISTEILLKYSAQPLHVRGRAEQWELDRNEMKFGRKIGEGDGGVIYRAEWRGLEVVAKMLRTDEDEAESNISMDIAKQDLVNEISVLSRLRHPNLVIFLGACTIGEPLVILSEYMPGGNLEDLLVKRMVDNKGVPSPPPNKFLVRWSIELARALCFLHNCSPPMIHRDLKPTNLLLDECGHLKVGDFGLCKVKELANVSGSYSMTGNTGSYRYMAPEVFKNIPTYDEKVDIYASAMIMWYIAMDHRPFDRVPAELVARQACETGLRPSLDAIIATGKSGKEYARLISKCWNADPAERLSATELVDSIDAWGKTMVDDKKEKNCTIS